MKRKLICAPIAMALAAFTAYPAFAQDIGIDQLNGDYTDVKSDISEEVNTAISTNTSTSNITLNKTMDVSKNVEIQGRIQIQGAAEVDSLSMAVINDRQVNYQNNVMNEGSTNNAYLNGDVAADGAGNIGINIAAGDNNQQANAAALAAVDTEFVFGSADAEAFAYQHGEHNFTLNRGQTNAATLTGNVGADAAGNIGINIAAGSSNQQKNDLAASVAIASVAEASIGVNQLSDHNVTCNGPTFRQETVIADIDMVLDLTGTSTGNAYQMTNLYPDAWTNDVGDDPVHPTSEPGPAGHIDIDTDTQGAVQNPDRPGVGGLGFDLVSDIDLSGSITGTAPITLCTTINTTNTAGLSGTVLAGAAGNIGVNIASGTGNQQYNGLALAAARAGAPGDGNGGGESLR